MTIIAGFKCLDGIVVCSDTQETVEHAKRNVPKLRYEPWGLLGSKMRRDGSDLAVAFSGAGYGPFIDKLTEQAWTAAQTASSIDEACDNIEDSIKNQYEHFGQIYQIGQCPEVQLIYGVKMNGQSRLFDASGPIVNEKMGYDSAGVGHYMADFLASRMYKNHLDIHQCVILAAYVLFQAKEHVDGCGGESHIAILRNEGVSGNVDWKRIEAITHLLKASDGVIGGVLLDAANLELTLEEFQKNVTISMGAIESLREAKRQELEDNSMRWDEVSRLLGGTESPKRDIFGLPAREE